VFGFVLNLTRRSDPLHSFHSFLNCWSSELLWRHRTVCQSQNRPTQVSISSTYFDGGIGSYFDDPMADVRGRSECPLSIALMAEPIGPDVCNESCLNCLCASSLDERSIGQTPLYSCFQPKESVCRLINSALIKLAAFSPTDNGSCSGPRPQGRLASGAEKTGRIFSPLLRPWRAREFGQCVPLWYSRYGCRN
jgi:hypothetical protein